MNIRKICALLALTMIVGAYSCKKEKKEGCTDRNATNFDSDAEVNKGCQYKYLVDVTLTSVASTDNEGNVWDDGGEPDVRIRFSKNSSSDFDYQTGIADDFSSATNLAVGSSVQFTNENWKYIILDDDGLLGTETIAAGTFNPLTSGDNGKITLANGSTVFSFNTNTR